MSAIDIILAVTACFAMFVVIPVYSYMKHKQARKEIRNKVKKIMAKCKNKEAIVDGLVFDGKTMRKTSLYVICTNDEHGKTLSIDNGNIQFLIPFEPFEEYLKGDCKQ